MLFWLRRIHRWRHEECIFQRWSDLEHLRMVPKVKDAPDSISVASLFSDVNLPFREPKRRAFVPARRLDSSSRSRPSGSKERTSYPYPSPSRSETHRTLSARSSRPACRRRMRSNSTTNLSPALPKSRFLASRSAGSNFPTSRRMAGGSTLSKSVNSGGATKVVSSFSASGWVSALAG